MPELPQVLVFASGTKDGGGSGFENLVKWSRLPAASRGFAAQVGANKDSFEVVGVVSNHENGGVRQRAAELEVSFTHFAGPFEAGEYQKIAQKSGAEWFALSGWLRKVEGLPPQKTFNIHPALLSVLDGRFGGEGMWGPKVAAAVFDALQMGQIAEFGISMHFVTDEYDRGPVFFEYRIPVEKKMTKDIIAKLTHDAEHEWQPKITNLVVHGEISWDGVNPHSVKVPVGYTFLPKSGI